MLRRTPEKMLFALLTALAVWLWLRHAATGGGTSAMPIDAKFVFSEALQ